MIQAVKSSEIEIIPDRFNKIYFHWIDNLRDWCISRQIWFGHRVPVWYRKEEIAVGEAPEGEGWVQDEDTLDTWFSSGLWTFSTLGWPNEKSADLKMYHPTTVLETGYDIIFFWVARMILMSAALLGEVPFKTVYLHGLVRDEQGRKMSKSLDNIINPLDMIAKYGADATRLSLILGATPGNDTKLSEEKVAGFRNFTNKLWNISRFVFGSVERVERIETVKPETLADRWILGRLGEVIATCTKHAAKHDYSLYGETLRDFTWSEFADWYLEIAKIEKGKDQILNYVLERLLILWHPFMPFVTEEIYKNFQHGLLMVANWPSADFKLAKKDREAFAALQSTITDVRNLRAEYQIEPKVLLDATILSSPELESCSAVIKTLARIENLSFGEAREGGVSTKLVSVYLKIDAEKERARLQAELADKQRYSASLSNKLSNADFIARAPATVVETERQKLAETNERIGAIEAQLKSLM
jgi:valyl-tRNA synthetase